MKTESSGLDFSEQITPGTITKIEKHLVTLFVGEGEGFWNKSNFFQICD